MTVTVTVTMMVIEVMVVRKIVVIINIMMVMMVLVVVRVSRTDLRSYTQGDRGMPTEIRNGHVHSFTFSHDETASDFL